MEQTEINEGNKLIAVFMSAEVLQKEGFFVEPYNAYRFMINPNPRCGVSTELTESGLEYNNRWDWLMPVVEKIAQMKLKYANVDEEYSPYPVTFGMQDEAGNFMVRLHVGGLFTAPTLIEATWLAVVAFIEWHNTQPQ